MFLGKDAGRAGSPGGAFTTQSNNIVLGDENITLIRTAVSVTATSDQRDKTDFTDLDLGLDFVKALAPVTFKWDRRSKYIDKSKDDWADTVDMNAIVPDGTHKEDRLDIGFKAQEVESLEESFGYKKDDKRNLLYDPGTDGTSYGMHYEKFVPILVKAIQELSAEVEKLKSGG
jgi:hypothetical protein